MAMLIAGVGVVAVVGIIGSGYVKAKPDEAIIISGVKKQPRIIKGKASFKIPFFERKDRLTLRVIKIDVKTKEAVPTNEFINVLVDSVVTVKVSTDAELIQLASENFLNQNESYIVDMVTDVLEGNIREIVGTMTLEDMISNRQEFSDRVQENAVPDMRRMGIEIVSFNVQNFSDENGVINDLGIDNTEKIKMNASIVKANAQRDVKIAQAEADKQANDATVKSEQEIAEKRNELAIKKAELKKASDTKNAEADSAYEIQREEQRKTIEVATANANLAKQEKEIELKEREVVIMQRTLEAEVEKKSESDRYASQQKADATLYDRKKKSEAERFEVEQVATGLKAKAQAEREAREQDSIGMRAIAMAEADGIRAKGLAEAEGIKKKAEAMKEMQEAAVLEMYFKTLPDIAEAVAKPLNNVGNITMYGDGNATKMISDITNSTTQIISGLSEGLGFDVNSVISGFVGGKMATPKNNIEEVDESDYELVEDGSQEEDSSETELNKVLKKHGRFNMEETASTTTEED